MPGGARGGQLPVQWEIRRLSSVDSTNRYLLDEARQNPSAAEGLVAVAAHQSQGRGRFDRRWESPEGASLLVSVLLRPLMDPAGMHWVVAAASLAAVEACREVAGVRPGLKWPNDLVVPGEDIGSSGEEGYGAEPKLAGVLAEADWSLEPPAVVVGMGLNLNWTVGSLVEKGLAESASSLNLLAGREIDGEAMLARYLEGLVARYALIQSGDQGKLVDEYRKSCTTLGRSVEVHTAQGVVTGVAVSVDGDGHLVLGQGGTSELSIAAGDVIHLRGPRDPR